jgi:hypothetical protein
MYKQSGFKNEGLTLSRGKFSGRLSGLRDAGRKRDVRAGRVKRYVRQMVRTERCNVYQTV